MSVFRKSSLDKLSSPEQLDKLIKITSPRSWLILAFFVLICVSTVIWSLAGSIPKKVQAQGIIINSGGTKSIFCAVDGEISDVTVEKNDYVYVGDILARVSQGPLVDEAIQVDQQIKEIEALNLTGKSDLKNAKESNLNLIDIKNQISDIDKQLNKTKNNDPSLKMAIDIEKSQIELEMYEADFTKKTSELNKIESDLAVNEKLLAAGAITQAEYDKLLDAITTAVFNKKNAELSIEQSKNNQGSLKKQLDQSRVDFTNEVNYLVFKRATLESNFMSTKNAKLDTLHKKRLEIEQKLNASEIVSHVEGKVIAVMANPGNMVQKGMEVAKILEKGDQINTSNAVFYVPVENGKKLTPGMRINVYPSTANRQEYGHMIAIITNISNYVVSADEMRARLGNEELVNNFLKQGVLVQVDTYLLKDEKTKSGYYWSNKKGKELSVLDGTMCSASVTVEKNKPITLLLPLLKEKFSPFEE